MPRSKKKAAPIMFDVWLRRKMGDFGLSPGEVAKAVDVNEGTVSRWLNEGRKPERRQVARLSVLFRVSPVDILRMTDPEEFLSQVEIAKRENGPQDVAADIADVLAQVPELRAFLGGLARMSPERRAALILLAREPEE